MLAILHLKIIKMKNKLSENKSISSSIPILYSNDKYAKEYLLVQPEYQDICKFWIHSTKLLGDPVMCDKLDYFHMRQIHLKNHHFFQTKNKIHFQIKNNQFICADISLIRPFYAKMIGVGN